MQRCGDTSTHLRDESIISADGLVQKTTKTQFVNLSQQHRKVTFGKAQLPQTDFSGNAIRTSRYTLITWAPKSLLMQFKRSANVYFLIISVLTTMSFSPKSPFSMVGTFAAVLIFTMLKEAYEDFFRYVQDRRVNKSGARVYDTGKGEFVEKLWRDVRVGDVLDVRDGESFPADMVFLSSSSVQGGAFVNTMNLDGETNLKEKMALELTMDMSESDLPSIIFHVTTDTPNQSLVKWNCNISMNGSKWQPMNINQLLLRSCQLKNTRRVYGLVIYTGQETKVMLNSQSALAKTSRLMKRMNKMLYTIYLMQFIICVTFAGLNVYFESMFHDVHVYLGNSDNPGGGSFAIQVLTFYVAYSHLIPISLYVSLDIVKLLCSYLINQDLQMYYAPDDRPASARTSDLVEELGQVEFVFSDKTGTLTQNVMKFKKCSVNGVVYGSAEGVGNAPGQDFRPQDILINGSPGDLDFSALMQFFRHMSLCHTVYPTVNSERGTLPLYQASSPDELALVAAAASLGFVFSEKTTNTLYCRNWGDAKSTWEILAEIPFNSNRKRMSIVLKEPVTKRVLLLSKGADQVMLPLLRPDQSLQSITETHLHEFAVEGLRTLVMCQRYIEQTDFDIWNERRERLQLSNEAEKDMMLDELGAELEHDLDLLGISAIEDKLQVGVPDTISILIAAGIRVWVLTGDKQETAIEIGKACNLITQDMTMIDLSSSSQDQFLHLLDMYTKQYVPFT